MKPRSYHKEMTNDELDWAICPECKKEKTLDKFSLNDVVCDFCYERKQKIRLDAERGA